jgi:hypothetical protein
LAPNSETVEQTQQNSYPEPSYNKPLSIFSAPPTASCVDLSTLTPIERVRRFSTKSLGSCTRFTVYEHFACTCETFCNDGNSIYCTCPGGVPELTQQDSLRSRPEFVGTTCTPCNTASVCGGLPAPPSPT